MLGPEGDDESFVLQVAGITLQHGGRIAGGDEFHAAESALLQGVRRFLEIFLEIRKVPLGVVTEEGVGRDTARRFDNALHGLHGQEGLGIFGDKSRSARFEQPAADLVLDGGDVVHIGLDRLSEDLLVVIRLAVVAVRMGVHGQAQGLGQVPLADRTAGQFLFDLGEVQAELFTDSGQVLVELGAHTLHLGVGFRLDSR